MWPSGSGSSGGRPTTGGSRRHPDSCLQATRTALSRVGKRLIEPELMAEYFTIPFRDARYFHRFTGKFYLHLLTVLRPVGK